MQACKPGSMLAVPLSESEVGAYLSEDVTLAVVNAPNLCVVAGPDAALSVVERNLNKAGIEGKRLRTSHAFHSAMMEPAVAPFVVAVGRHALHAPRIPFVSNVTGTWITPEEATSPQYWARHLRSTVRFAAGLRVLGSEPGRLMIEVGPGSTLKTLTRQALTALGDDSVLTSLPHPAEKQPERALLVSSLGRIWLAGVPVRWQAMHAGRRRRIALPTYPFESRTFFVRPSQRAQGGTARAFEAARHADIADWFWLPSWQRGTPLNAMASTAAAVGKGRWLVFADDSPASEALLAALARKDIPVVTVRAANEFAWRGENACTIVPDKREDYDRLLREVIGADKQLACVLHLWNVSPQATQEIDAARGRRLGFYSLLYFAQALADSAQRTPVPVLAVSANMQKVRGNEALVVERSLLTGPVLVMSQDVPAARARSIDLDSADWNAAFAADLATILIGEAATEDDATSIAYREGYRWTATTSAIRLQTPAAEAVAFRERGAYLVTGGTGGIGLVIARHLASTYRARLVLTARTALPPREKWDTFIAAADANADISARIRTIRELEGFGAEVLVVAADVSDADQMTAALAEARRRFGAFNGVLHAAGTPGVGILPLKTRDQAEGVLRPKVEGTLLLDRLLAGANLDFLLLFSSINTAFGWLGTTDYSSANAFLDAFAQAGTARSTRRVVCLNWGTWRGVGMAAAAARTTERSEQGEALLQAAIAADEGIEALRRALASSLPQLFVTPRPMPTLMQEIRSATTQMQAQHTGAAAAPASAPHDRPALDTEFVAPRDDAERQLAAIWSELLGIEQIGVHDNFFDLGGHSLLATRVLARVQDTFKARLPMRALFDAPTVAELVAHVQAALWARQPGAGPATNADEVREEIEL